MIFIILSWIYIASIFFSFGVAYTAFADRITKVKDPGSSSLFVPHISVVLVAGMICTTILASLFSLFMPLSLPAHLIVLMLAVAILIAFRKKAGALLSAYKAKARGVGWIYIVLFAGYALVVAYLSFLPSSHNDDGLYYSNTIKWVEEYGVVKGLANVNTRLGFNSNWHVLQALFSFHYLNAGNFNDLNGLLLLMVFPYSVTGVRKLRKGDYSVATITRALFFLPLFAFHFGASSDFLFFNINFLSAPAADLAVCILVWLTLICLAELDHSDNQAYPRQAMFIVFTSVFLFTVKPSAAPLVMTGVGFFFVYLFKKQFAKLTGLIVLTLFILTPWIARNIIISGYPVFPLSAADVLQVDWKLPVQHVKWHENAVKVYAINPEYDLSKPFTMPFIKWFPVWFGRLTYIQSVIFAFSVLSVIVFAVTGIAGLFRKKKRFILRNGHLIFALFIATCGLLFWLTRAPDPRLGYGYSAMLSMFMLAVWLHYFLGPYARRAGIVVMMVFYYILLFYYKDAGKNGIPESLTKALPERRMPKEVSNVPMGNGIVLHLAEDADLWYMSLPVAVKGEYAAIRPIPRGNSIKDGFKANQK
jgi:hypothetical protein